MLLPHNRQVNLYHHKTTLLNLKENEKMVGFIGFGSWLRLHAQTVFIKIFLLKLNI